MELLDELGYCLSDWVFIGGYNFDNLIDRVRFIEAWCFIIVHFQHVAIINSESAIKTTLSKHISFKSWAPTRHLNLLAHLQIILQLRQLFWLHVVRYFLLEILNEHINQLIVSIESFQIDGSTNFGFVRSDCHPNSWYLLLLYGLSIFTTSRHSTKRSWYALHEQFSNRKGLLIDSCSE